MSLIKREYSNLNIHCMINHSKIVHNKCQHTTNEEKSQINANFIFTYNQPKTEIPTSIYKMGAPSVKLPLISWLFIIPFNFGYVYITISGLKKYMKYMAPNV